MKFGAIYIAHNPRDGADVFKVGLTERSVEERMKELTASTSNLGQYTAMASFVVLDVESAETACHKRLSQYRLQANREFFQLELTRLIKIVQEVVQLYRAVDMIPELPDSVPMPTKSMAEKLSAARKGQAEAEDEWETARSACLRTIQEWHQAIGERLSRIKHELAGEDLVRFQIPATCELNRSRQYDFGTILILSKITGKPIEIPHSGLRGDIYGDLDLTNAVSGSIEGKSGSSLPDKKAEYEFVSWKELDDGRVGKISLTGLILGDYKGAKRDGDLPSCHLYLRAKHTVFDGYDEKMEERGLERDLRDPDEALDMAEAILVHNISMPQADVRYIDESNYQKTRRGRGYRIKDKGRFETNIFD